MRTREAIEGRIRFLLTEELDVRVRLATSRVPHMCQHNHRQALDVRKRVEDEVNEFYNRITRGPRLPVLQTMGLCMLNSENPEEWNGTLCEDPIDAQRCPYFDPKETKSSVWAHFSEQIANPDWLKEHMPEVYGLMWGLDTTQGLVLPWWKRLWYYMLRIQVEPIRVVVDPVHLLPERSK